MQRSYRHRGMLLLTFIAVFLGLFPTHSTSATPIQPLPSAAASNAILIDEDDYQSLQNGQAGIFTITPETDEDVLYIQAEAGKEISVAMTRLSSDGALNGTLSLYDPAGALMSIDANSGGHGNPLLERIKARTTGQYEVHVRDESGTRTGQYQLIATVADPLIPDPVAGTLDYEPDPCPEPTSTPATPSTPQPANGPTNPQFDTSATDLPRTTYPLNCSFARGEQLLPGFPASTAFTITGAVSSYVSDVFTVPTAAQALKFEYAAGDQNGGSRDLTIFVRTGANFATRTEIGRVSGDLYEGWKPGIVNLMSFQGQTIKLEWKNVTAPRAEAPGLQGTAAPVHTVTTPACGGPAARY